MLTDAHCHPFDLTERLPPAETMRRQLGIMAAASAASIEEFAYCEQLSLQAKSDCASPLLPCFAIHPQQLTVNRNEATLAVLEALASEGKLAAIGETGFDLYNAEFRGTEGWQDAMFAGHLELALRHDLPLVIHARRAMHKVFAYSAGLKKCKAVIFHSWSGTSGEGESLLKRGVNAFFSFGTTIMLNHREAMRCCALFPAERLLTETDAPFQPLRGKAFSAYADLPAILQTMEYMRGESAMETIIEHNFRSAFGIMDAF